MNITLHVSNKNDKVFPLTWNDIIKTDGVYEHDDEDSEGSYIMIVSGTALYIDGMTMEKAITSWKYNKFRKVDTEVEITFK